MNEYLDRFYLDREEPQKSTLLALRSIICEFDKNITETVKYGMPCFLFKNNIFCYLWIDNKTMEPYILMAEGNYLTNPYLEKGSRSRMKILRIDPYKDIPITIIEYLFKEAISLYVNDIVRLK